MKFHTLSAIAAVLAAHGVVHAQEPGIERGPAPAWAEESELLPLPEDARGMIYVRRSDMLVRLHDDGQSQFLSQRFAILNPQALQAGNITIAWNPAVGNPTVHRLLVHRDGETVDVLENTDFEILRREEQLEEAMLHGILTAVLKVPDLRVGDELELAYSMPSHDSTLRDESFGVLMLAPVTPEGHVRLGLQWEDGQKPRYAIPAGLERFVSEGENRVDIRAVDAPPATTPNNAPPRYAFDRVMQYTDFDSWAAVSRRFHPLFEKASAIPAHGPVAREAARIAAAHAGSRERAQAALELVQRQVRYIYVGLNGGNLTPVDAETTWERRYGDCKGKTALLLALLDALDIEAQAVLVNNQSPDDGMDERLPSPGEFDHVLVRATIDGEQYWLDGTLPDVIEMREKPAFAYRWVLPLSAPGTALDELPPEPFALPQEMGIVEIDARAGFDEPARKVSTMVRRGPAAIAEYQQFSATSPAQIEAAFKNNVDGTFWNAIERVEYRFDRATQASILTIEGTGPVDWDDEGGGAYDLTLPGGGFSPPSRKFRPADQDQTAPYWSEPVYSCYATTVRFPEDTEIENWGFNSVFDTVIYGRLYYRMMEKRDDMTLRLVRGSRSRTAEIVPQTAERDNRRLGKFDNSRAALTYDPKREMESWGRLTPVPATYEIDWTGADAPCLPADLMEE